MKSILLNEMAKKKMVSLYTDTSETDKFAVGFILGVNDDFLLLNSIETNGMNDGLYLMQLEDVFRVSFDGEYEEKIKKLYEMQGQKPMPNMQDDDLFSVFFTYAKNNSMIVSLKVCDSEVYDISGLVEEISGETIRLKCFSNYGKDDGISIIKNDHITKATCNSDYECILSKIINYSSKHLK